MRPLRLLLKLYSYAVNIAVALASLAISAVILRTKNPTLHLGWLPWSGEDLGSILAAVGVAGVAVVLLSVAGRLQWLLVLYSLVVLWLVVRGLFFSPWQFAGSAEFTQALWISGALLVSVTGAVPLGKKA